METGKKFIINDPCTEDWNKMTPKEQGRFCDVCSKCVVDLSEKSPEQIFEIYRENKGDLCGRMKLSQMDTAREARETARFFNMSLLTRIQIFAASLVLIFCLNFTNLAQAQDLRLKGKVAYVNPYGQIEGQVKYDSGHNAAGYTLKLFQDGHLKYTTTSNEEGHYTFARVTPGKYLLKVESYGWTETEVKVKVERDQVLEKDLTVIDEMIEGDIAYYPEEPIDEEPEVIEIEEIEPLETMILGQIAVPTPDVTTQCTGKNPVEGTEAGGPDSAEETQLPEAYPEHLAAPTLDMTVYPNPTTGAVSGQVELPEPSAMEVWVTDLKGQVLRRDKFAQETNGAFSLDLGKLANGIYILKVVAGDATGERRLVKTE